MLHKGVMKSVESELWYMAGNKVLDSKEKIDKEKCAVGRWYAIDGTKKILQKNWICKKNF